ncbi:peptide-methionine (S)-S-oxide reductase MsrA [Mesorhizobium sp. J428]|uniref:peptide-methionine (S)-S-oxide reductase MsrA n=1 Tax=Mesorhizobium sp. J428 TaxID=2898440 RepID=UPI00215176CC|nr:peptide-methionine (S)-S-oxide reductase MsrA [Mesorhizobium sp. J428]MCR5856992.1 peptide-methionine (S)-S-oxide reductase MsrA [Mesorhizobium sp. J428]
MRLAAAALATAVAFQPLAISQAGAETAIFAGGCFWCVESDMDHVPGVTETVSGYSGGTKKNPTYYDHEGHREVVRVEFDPAKISYEQLATTFLRTIDPTDAGGQFCDRGHAYTTAIYAVGDAQLAAARKAKAAAEAQLGVKLATEVAPAGEFTEAEDYHQNYYQVSAAKYKYYRFACGRDERVKEVWGADAYKGVPAH